jgi:WD40 repeat protein
MDFSLEEDLATYGHDYYVCIWSRSEDQVKCKWKKFIDGAGPIAFGLGGRIACGVSKDVQVWDTDSDEFMQRSTGHNHDVTALIFISKEQLLSASHDASMRLSAIGPHEERASRTETKYSEVTACSFSDDGLLLASGHFNGDVRTWTLESGQELQLYEGHTKRIDSIVISSKFEVIASSRSDFTTLLWTPASTKALHCFNAAHHTISVACSPNGKTVASGDLVGFIMLWDAHTGKEQETLYALDKSVRSMAFSPDGTMLLSGHAGRALLLWSLSNGEVLRRFECDGNNLTTVAMSSRNLIASASAGGWPVKLWDKDSEMTWDLSADATAPAPTQLEFSYDGKILRTNAGTFDLTGVSPSSPVLRPALRLSKMDDWVQLDGEDVLWIPHEHRPRFSGRAITHGSTLVIGTTSLGLSIFRMK